MSKIRLCVVSPLYNPYLGGVGRQAVAITEYLYKSGVKVFAICRDIKGIPEFRAHPEVHIIKVRSVFPSKINLQEKTAVNFLVSLSFSLSLMVALFRNRKQYGIVHFHGASLPLIVNILPLKLMSKKVVAKVAGAKMDIEAGSFKGKYLFIGDFIIRLLKIVDAFIAISSEIKTDLIKDGFDKEKIFEISNVIVPEAFFPLTDKKKRNALKHSFFGNDTDILTFSGRLVETKRLDVFFTAFREILKKKKNLHLFILGDGELKEKLISMTYEYRIQDNVSFLGFVTNILDYLHITDIFVFPSEREGLPNSLLEAMACKLPVIAASTGGIVDVVKHRENGLLVTPGNAEELKEAILELLENRDLSEMIAEKAYQTISERYYIDGIADKYVLLYKKLLHAG
jgi:glycosyltransferase involved in cell wall biosynthesis